MTTMQHLNVYAMTNSAKQRVYCIEGMHELLPISVTVAPERAEWFDGWNRHAMPAEFAGPLYGELAARAETVGEMVYGRVEPGAAPLLPAVTRAAWYAWMQRYGQRFPGLVDLGNDPYPVTMGMTEQTLRGEGEDA